MQTYNTALEREGHPSLPPFPPTVTGPSVKVHAVASIGLVSSTPSESAVIETVHVTVTVVDTGSTSATISSVSSTAQATAKIAGPLSNMDNQDAFQAVALDPVPTNIPTNDNHPAPRLGIVSSQAALA